LEHLFFQHYYRVMRFPIFCPGFSNFFFWQ
jgi:hypothetical protein